METTNTHIMELFGAFLTGIVGPILYLLIDRYISKQKESKQDKVRESIDNTCTINQELEEIMDEFGGDRVWISQFHNGGNFYPTGKSIQKFSIFYEVTRPGVAVVAHIFSNIPCSLYPKAFQHMLNHNGIFIPDYEDETISTYGLKASAETAGDKSSYLLPLFTLDEKYIGVVGIDYTTRKYRMKKDEWEHFQIKASRIAGYLSSYLDKK